MPVLTPDQRAFLAASRTATLATAGGQGRPRLVPICFALAPDDDERGRATLYTPLDEKPKRAADVRDLARVKDILVLPEVTLLVDRWDEDWSRLAWLRLYGVGELLEPQPHEVEEHARAIGLLRGKYPQYAGHALETLPIICVRIDRAVGWAADRSA
ncbi:MAG: TIGR03668 family PPOX class F420-dependent oxidoreductase [Chloroflexota bacterium]